MANNLYENEQIVFKQYLPGTNINITDAVISGKDWQDEIDVVKELKEDKIEYVWNNGKIATINGSALYTPGQVYSAGDNIEIDEENRISVTGIKSDSWKIYSEENGSSGEGYYIGSGNNIDVELPENIEVTQHTSIGNLNTTTIPESGVSTTETIVNTIQVGLHNSIIEDKINKKYKGINLGINNTISGEGINLGDNNSARGYTINIGRNNSGLESTKIFGDNNKAKVAALCCGNNNTASNCSIIYGNTNNGLGSDILVGQSNTGNGDGVIVGHSNFASGGGISIGNTNSVNGDSISLGENNTIKNNSCGIGKYNIANDTGGEAFLIGFNNTTLSEGWGSNYAFGKNNSGCTDTFTIGRNNYNKNGYIFGYNCSALNNSLVLGCDNLVPKYADLASVVIGLQGSSANGGSFVAGTQCTGYGGSFTIGIRSSATEGSTAIGGKISAYRGSVGLGGIDPYYHGGTGKLLVTQGSLALALIDNPNATVYSDNKSMILGSTNGSISANNGSMTIVGANGNVSAFNEAYVFGQYISAQNQAVAIGNNIHTDASYCFGEHISATNGSMAFNSVDGSAFASAASLILRNYGSYGGKTSALKGSVSIGGDNIIKYASTALGTYNNVNNWSVALGNYNYIGSDSNGTDKDVEGDSTHTFTLGYHNTATNPLNGIQIWSFTDNDNTTYNQNAYSQNIILGNFNNVNNHITFINGVRNTAFSSTNPLIVKKSGSTVTEIDVLDEGHSVVFGRNNLYGNRFDFIRGKFNSVSGTDDMGYNTVFGSYNTLTNCKKNTIIGDNHTLTNISGQTIIGDYSTPVTNGLLVVANGTSTTNSNAMIVSADGTVSANKFVTESFDSNDTDLTAFIQLLKNRPTEGSYVLESNDGVLSWQPKN